MRIMKAKVNMRVRFKEKKENGKYTGNDTLKKIKKKKKSQNWQWW